jgi:N-acetylglucosamine-6-phosphate deacetylase
VSTGATVEAGPAEVKRLSRSLGVARALVEGGWVDGDVIVADGRIADVGVAGSRGRGAAVPGFVDVQVNGFAGVDFTVATDPADHDRAAMAMAATGVTSFLLTVPTTEPARYDDLLAAAAETVARPGAGARALGVHLEGPFLNPAKRGAHREAWLRLPTDPAVDGLLRPEVVMMTLAPELPGGLELVARLRRAGVVVSVGHSMADAAEAHAAFDAGAAAVTHQWNGQRPILARDPGVGAVALVRPDVFVGLIGDLVHVAAEMVLLTMTVAAGRVVLVTDALAGAGTGSGWGGAVRGADGRLAGSTTTMDTAVRNLVGLGVPLATAVTAAGRTPASLLGRRDLGVLRRGERADVVVLDDRLEVGTVLVGGERAGA